MNNSYPATTTGKKAGDGNEAALLAAARKGCCAAFEELVNRYGQKIHRLGLKITGSPQDAEEVLQDTFLKAFEHLGNFRGDSGFYTWVVRIAVNEALMKLRKRRGERLVAMEIAADNENDAMPREFADPWPNPEQILLQAESHAILNAAAQSLPPGFRSVYVLRDLEEFSIRETMQLLGLTVASVKTRLLRARRRVRRELCNTPIKESVC